MTERIAIELDVQTGDKTERPLTDIEIADLEQISIEGAEQMAAFKEKEEKKSALLERLGISEEEAKLLLA